MRSQLDRFHRAQRSGSEEQDPQRASHDVAHTHTPHTLARRLPGGPGGFLLRHPAPPSRTARSSARTDGSTEALAARPLFCGRLGAYGLYSWAELMQPPATCQKSWGILGRSCAWVVVQREESHCDPGSCWNYLPRSARSRRHTRVPRPRVSREPREPSASLARRAAPAVQHIEIDIYLYSRALFRV